MSTNRFNCMRCGALITPSVERYQVKKIVAGGAVCVTKVEAYLCAEHGAEMIAAERQLATKAMLQHAG